MRIILGNLGEFINAMKIFNYTFYRISDYYKKKKDSSAELTGAIILTVIQVFVIIDLFVLVRIFYEYKIPNNFSKFWFLPIYFLFLLLNWLKYVKPKKYRDYRKLWKDENTNHKKKNGWLIVLVLVSTILIPIIYGIVRHNIMGGKSFF